MSKGELVQRNSESDKFLKDQKKYADTLKRLLKTEKELEKERSRLDSRMEKLVSVCQPVLDEIISLKIEIVELLFATVTAENSTELQREYYYKIIHVANDILRMPHSLSHAKCEELGEMVKSASQRVDELSALLKEEERQKMNLSADEQMDMVLEMLDEAETACAMHGVLVDFSDADLTLHPHDFEAYIREKIKLAFQKRDLLELIRLEAEWAGESDKAVMSSNPKDIKNHIGLLLQKIKSLKTARTNMIHDAKYFKLRYIGVTYYGVYDASPKEILKTLEEKKSATHEKLRMLTNPKSRKRALRML